MIIIKIEFAYEIIIIKTNLNQNILQYELKSCDGFFSLIRFFMQHRFYGKSVPFVSSKDALKNATLRGYFNSAQALADYARFSYTSRKIYRTKCLPLWLLEHLMEEVNYNIINLLTSFD